MIFTIGITGLLAVRFSIDAKPRAVHRVYDSAVRGTKSVKQRGCLVWDNLNDAILAARFCNEKAMREQERPALTFHQTWIVVGVEADWQRDTDAQDFWPQFPTARELAYPACLVELQQDLPI